MPRGRPRLEKKVQKQTPKQPNPWYTFDFTDFATLLNTTYKQSEFRIMTLTTFYRVDLRAITNVDISWEVDEDKDIMYLVVTITDKSFVYSLCQTTRVPASTEEPSGKCVARVAFENDMTTDNVIPLYFQAKINDKIREFWTKNNTSCHPYDYDSDYDVATYEDLQ